MASQPPGVVDAQLPQQLRGNLMWASLAALFDGEGCIRIDRARPRGNCTLNKYSVDLRVLNTNIGWMYAWKNRLSAGTVSKPIQTDAKSKPRVQWAICRKGDMRRLLQGMLPFLFCKREQAILALDFLAKFKPSYGRVAGVEGYVRCKPSTQEMSWREEMFQRMRLLNQKGVAL